MIYASEHELERFMGKCKQMIRSGGENVSKEKEILTGFFPCIVVLAEQFMTETLPMGCLWEGLAHTHDVGPKSPKGPTPRPSGRGGRPPGRGWGPSRPPPAPPARP